MKTLLRFFWSWWAPNFWGCFICIISLMFVAISRHWYWLLLIVAVFTFILGVLVSRSLDVDKKNGDI